MEYIPSLAALAGGVTVLLGAGLVATYKPSYTRLTLDGVRDTVPARGIPLRLSLLVVGAGVIFYVLGYLAN